MLSPFSSFCMVWGNLSVSTRGIVQSRVPLCVYVTTTCRRLISLPSVMYQYPPPSCGNEMDGVGGDEGKYWLSVIKGMLLPDKSTMELPSTT